MRSMHISSAFLSTDLPEIRHLTVRDIYKDMQSELGKRRHLISVKLFTIISFPLLRGGPCKNRPLEFPWETEFLHFFSATKLAHSINKNRICLAHSAFLKKIGPRFAWTVKSCHDRLFKGQISAFCSRLAKISHSPKQHKTEVGF